MHYPNKLECLQLIFTSALVYFFTSKAEAYYNGSSEVCGIMKLWL
jgi:hypothetical protein